MRRRKFQLLLFGCLLVVLAGWILSPAAKGTGDEQEYRQMRRARHWSSRLHIVRRRLPGFLVRLLDTSNLVKQCEDKARTQQLALLATGYLTNATITITNLPATATNHLSTLHELKRRLGPQRHVEYVYFSVPANDYQAVVLCRTQDVALVRTAIESP
jgi:hypothetical protein